MTITQDAEKLLHRGDISAAINLVQDAARNNDADAIRILALWRVFGYPLDRDFAAARALFARSAASGCPQAAFTHAVFLALGAGGISDWQSAVQVIEQWADSDPIAANQISLLKAMDLTELGYPKANPASEPLSQAPPITMVRQFLSPNECAHIKRLARPLLVPSVVVDPVTGRETLHPVRTSDGAVLGPVQMDIVTEALNRRIAKVTATNVEQGEPLVVLRYTKGQQFRLHHDCLPGERNQREYTMIVFLNEDFDGGETVFPEIDMRVRGATGDAIFFKNTRSDNQVEELCRHAGLPVTSGEKWICTRWIRSRPFDPWGMRTR